MKMEDGQQSTIWNEKVSINLFQFVKLDFKNLLKSHYLSFSVQIYVITEYESRLCP